MRLTEQQQNFWFIIALLIAAGLELLAASLAYYTIGAVVSSLLFIMVGFNVVPLMFHFLKQRWLAIVAALVIFGFLVPYQVVLGHRWWALQQEANQLVPYIYQTRVETGDYPTDLSGYEHLYPNLETHINYEIFDDCEGFAVWYFVSTPNTSHLYHTRQCENEQYAGWFYSDD